MSVDITKDMPKPVHPLATNILRLHDYLLAPDEVVLFDALVVKSISFHYKTFYYSQQRIEREMRIKRTRFEKIIKMYEEMGWLTTYIDKIPETDGQIRYFYVNFTTLAQPEILGKIVRGESGLFADMQAYMLHHSDMAYKASTPATRKEERKKKKDSEIVEEIRVILQDTMNERRKMYNNGEITDEKPKRTLLMTTLALTAQQKNSLLELNYRYGTEAIRQSFTAYYDCVLEGDSYKPKNLLNYFLSKDKFSSDYGIFTDCLNGFSLAYSGPRKR